MDSGIVHLKRKIYQKCNKNKEKNQISHRQPPLQQNRDDLSNLDFFSKACIVSAIVFSHKKTMSNLPISKINQKPITFFNFLQERIKYQGKLIQTIFFGAARAVTSFSTEILDMSKKIVTICDKSLKIIFEIIFKFDDNL